MASGKNGHEVHWFLYYSFASARENNHACETTERVNDVKKQQKNRFFSSAAMRKKA